MEKCLFFMGNNGAVQKLEASFSGPRIVGGRNAFPQELPFQVSYVKRNFFVCKILVSVKFDKKELKLQDSTLQLSIYILSCGEGMKIY
jgi:hypothetical protein